MRHDESRRAMMAALSDAGLMLIGRGQELLGVAAALGARELLETVLVYAEFVKARRVAAR